MRTVTEKTLPPFARVLMCILLLTPLPALATLQCYDCHGTKLSPDSGDVRPVDSPLRNISSGGFQGNHQTHMDAAARQATCAKCHPGSADYTQSHRDGVITISFNINSSPLRAVYRNGSTSFPQTPLPRLGSCSNVNCHFERETRTWGADTLTVPSGCSECHGSPPNGGDGGAAGSHASHDRYYPGIAGCARCHADHSLEANPFSHATSAGRTLSLIIQNPVTSVRGAYSGNLDDYLPKSSTNSFGSCSNIYCHSKGDSSTTYLPNVQPVWGGSLPADCSGCHGNGHGTGAEITSGSHTIHVGKDYFAQYVYTCSICHSSTAAGNNEIANRSNHVNLKIDVSVAPLFGGSYSADGHAPGAATGSCQNVYCHSNVQPDGGIGGPTVYTDPVWGDADSIRCGECHAGDGGHGHGGAKIATGSHARHLAYGFTATSNTVRCMICHKYTNQPFVPSCFGNPYGNTVCHLGTGAKHANGEIDVRLDPTFGNMSAYQGAPAPGNGYSNCANTYCHSSGVSVATGIIPPSTTTNWGSGPIGCGSCHGNPPSYTSGTLSKANSHTAHTANCSVCHYATTTNGTTISSTTTHVNKAFDLQPGAGISFSYQFNGTSSGSCSTISCHFNGNATWGTELPCNGCHAIPPQTTAHLKHFGGTLEQAGYGDTRIAKDYSATSSAYIFNCGNCHPLDPGKHINGLTEVELYNVASPAGSLKFRNGTSARYIPETKTCQNVSCHSYNDFVTPTDCVLTNESTSRVCDTYAQNNLQVIRRYKNPVWDTNLPNDCSGCHANAPRTTFATNDGMTGDSHAWGNPEGYEQGHFNKEWFTINPPITCNYCHNDTVQADSKWWRSNPPYYTNFSSVPIANKAKHVNGTNDVAFEKTKPYVMTHADWWGNPVSVTLPLTNASYNTGTKTCTNVSCHLDQTSVKWGKTYRGSKAWYGIDYVCWECHSDGYY